MHPASLTNEQLLRQCDLRTDRRSGPGGQHRNKVETAVIVAHRATGILAEASERRSQADNRRVAIFRLRLALAVAYRTPFEVGAKPSELWQSRVHGRRLSVSASSESFPALLAELLDHLQAVSFSLRDSSKHFAVSSTQLIKLLRSHPPALAKVNAYRLAGGLKRLT